MPFDISTRAFGGDIVVSLIGRLVDVDVKKFSRKLSTVVNERTPRVILDVSRLNFINSTALGVIVVTHTQLRKENRELIVLNGNPNPQSYVNRLVEVTNLHTVIRFIRSMKELGAGAGPVPDPKQ
jgi:anti-anti-sigma factor